MSERIAEREAIVRWLRRSRAMTAPGRDGGVSDRARYVQESERVIAEAKRRLATHEGACIDCRHWRPGVVHAVCANPIVRLAAFNKTDHYAAERIQECVYQRDTSNLYGPVVCGPDGTLFEKRRWSLWLIPAALLLLPIIGAFTT